MFELQNLSVAGIQQWVSTNLQGAHVLPIQQIDKRLENPTNPNAPHHYYLPFAFLLPIAANPFVMDKELINDKLETYHRPQYSPNDSDRRKADEWRKTNPQIKHIPAQNLSQLLDGAHCCHVLIWCKLKQFDEFGRLNGGVGDNCLEWENLPRWATHYPKVKINSKIQKVEFLATRQTWILGENSRAFDADKAKVVNFVGKTLQNIYSEVKTLQDLYSFFSVTNKE